MKTKSSYKQFDQINGEHNLRDVVDGFCIEYKVRQRKGGKLVFFNFELAKEMGLIPKNHDNKLNDKLKKKILDTFSLVIINEYDLLYKKKFKARDIKKNTYMATRYLQLQHNDKLGKNSGDGRSIWNGQFKGKNGTWDISSTGTGATRLSPATSKYNRFFQTGDPSISYGCGYSEIQEGIETLFFSEVMEQNNIGTERILALISYDNNTSINIRAGKNLLRPSHFFIHLKQSNWSAVKSLTDYYLKKQHLDGVWEKAPKSSKLKYDFFLEKVIKSFAEISADFEDEYIFCWLDWDGDNILMDGSIIDYGSIRQFGLYHSEYRYDDDERFSTSLAEQKQKAKYIIQCFIQMVDFIKTKNKKSLSKFKNHKYLVLFETLYIERKRKNILKKIGVEKAHLELMLKKHPKIIDDFRKVFHYFEKVKSKQGKIKVADGITCNAVFCMRDIMRELPQLLLFSKQLLTAEEFIEILKSHYAEEEDLEINTYRRKKVMEFQRAYLKIVHRLAALKKEKSNDTLLQVLENSSIINRFDRITGNAITIISEKITGLLDELKPEHLVHILEQFKNYQSFNPRNIYPLTKKKVLIDKLNKKEKKTFEFIVNTVKNYREGL